jgi:hypothetical protein
VLFRLQDRHTAESAGVAARLQADIVRPSILATTFPR